MNKKKYIVPFCRVHVTETEVLIANSRDEWMDISSEETTDDYASMSNEKRNGGSIWDQGW